MNIPGPLLWVIAGAIVAVVLKIVAESILRRRRSSSIAASSFASRKTLLSDAEISLDGLLRSELASDMRLCPKVRVADVLKLATWNGPQFATISQKHFDWVIIHDTSSEIVAAIELDDSSHGSAKARKADDIKNRACADAGIKIIRIKAKKFYDVDDVRKALAESS